MMFQRVSQRAFIAASMLLFATSTALTIAWCRSMSAMHDMPMPGGWTMSMMWMRMPGQTWPGSAAAFLGMWLVMMVAMMLPSLMPMLWRYRRATAGTSKANPDALTAVVGTAYFVVWILFGAVVFVVGTAVASVAMEFPLFARAVPIAAGATVLIAGMAQFSVWKARHLACCRGTSEYNDERSADARTAWRHGLRLGAHCVHCCFGLTTILLVVGMMDLRAMAAVTAAISVERLAPGGARAARLVGAVAVVAGLLLVVQTTLPV